MNPTKNKLTTFGLTLILIITLGFSLTLSTTLAHTPAWEVPTYAFINIAPDPVGVGQQAMVVFWIDKTLPSAAVANNIRIHDYELKITNPEGKTETKTWDIIWDTTSSQYTPFTPDKVGVYTFNFTYKGQTYEWSGQYNGDKYLPSTASTTLTVQDEPIPDARSSYPLPSEYWTRPIEGQNTDWYGISSNWLGTGSPPLSGWARYQPDGIGSNTSHIMWTKPIQDGGVLGGSEGTGVLGNMFYMGMTYNQRFSNPIIMDGRLIYHEPYGNARGGGDMVAVDLRTGGELWRTNTTGIGEPAFGYYYAYEDGNQHGILPEGLLFTNNFARAYNPSTGRVTNTNITNVPSGVSALGTEGEHLRYVITNLGTAQSPNYYLAQWNSSKINAVTVGQIGVQNWYPANFAAGVPRMYDWNVSLPAAVRGLATPAVVQAIPGDILLGRSTTFISTSTAVSFGTPDPYTFWAVSLKPGDEGRLLWVKNYPAPDGNVSIIQGPANPIDPINRVFVTYTKETMSWTGYSLDTGNIVWGPKSHSLSGYDYYEGWLVSNIAYGKLYTSNYGGILYAMDTKTGDLLWTYGNGGAGNSTSSGMDTVWGRYPIWIGAIADDKIYLLTSEHSPNTPMYKDAKIRCVDAQTGAEIWTMLGFGGVAGSAQMALADGYLVYLNCYDMQIYSVGKGPSRLIVNTPQTGVELGKSLLISGTVTDISAGTQQNEQAARFPNGVPAVSDVSQSAWMEYVYMQKPRPTNVTGVEVELYVLDANNNYRSIGTTTADADGFFSHSWIPDIEGKYMVYASFAGSTAYWPSHATTAFSVDPPPLTPPPTDAPKDSIADQYFAPAIAGLFAVVIIVGAILALMLKKRV
ncbi:MAG: PQQ-binding-like beta-propeller repeat protein [Nitrososphaerota archaeon]|jgi:hypothetical protein|nr:PQQ-binding-like beta-propeller repeat protein [Nitrososphaerota archaeon]